MNCKEGDLAVYVGKLSPRDVGAIVTCVRFLGVRRVLDGSNALVWEVTPPLRYTEATRKDWISDCSLRPIRDNPGQDETLSWAPVPKKVEA